MTVKSRFLLLALSLMLLLPAFVSAQGDPLRLVFLGRTDSNADGVVDAEDRLALYAGGLNSVTIPVSSANENVMQFDVLPDFSSAAYTAETPEGTILNIVQLSNLQATRYPVTDIEPVSVDLFEGAVWLVGLNADSIPVLRGLDLATGTVIDENTFRRPNTDVTVHSSGKWALAFNQEAGALSVLSLPTLDVVMFELQGFAIAPPIWSPTDERFMIAIADLNNNADFKIAVVDVTLPQTTVIDVPDYPLEANLNLKWSDNGRYITYTAQDASNPLPAPLTIIDVAAGTTTSLSDPAAFLSVVEWSVDDSYALVSRQPVTTNSNEVAFQEFRLYESATGTLNEIPALADFEALAVEWSPTAATLAVMGQSLTTGRQGVYLLSVPDGLVTPVFDSDVEQFSAGDVYWMNDGAQIVYTAPSSDAISTSLGTPLAAFVVDPSTGAVGRVSPEGVLVELVNFTAR